MSNIGIHVIAAGATKRDAGRELPFRDESATGIAASFYRLFKTHILGRFLCLRRPSIRSG